MTRARLHYIFDPLCGWCYGAAPLVMAARDVMEVVAHGGGMMVGSNRKAATPEWRAQVLPHDRRIATMSGQPFGLPYFDGLLRDETAVFDSEPPTAAILAADQLAGKGLDLLARLQTAHYVEGRRISDLDVLIEQARRIGLDRTAFKAAYEASIGKPLHKHFYESRSLLRQVGGKGYPTFVLERDGAIERLDSSAYFGRPGDWQAMLTRAASSNGAARA